MRILLLAVLVLWPQEEDNLRVAWGPIRTVDPALAIAPQDVRVAEALFDGLEGVEAKADGAVVTFTLPDRKWTDGRPVTASDYRFAWLRCLDPATGSPWAFRFRHLRNARAWHEAETLSARLLRYENEVPAQRDEVAKTVGRIGTKRHSAALALAAEGEKDETLKAAVAQAVQSAGSRDDLSPDAVGVAAIDARTLKVTLEAPVPGFARLAATSPFRPVPRHVVEAKRDRWTHPQEIVTCGPYRIERWKSDGLVLARSAPGDSPGKVAFVPSDRIAEIWPLFERGTVDWVDGSLVPPEKVEALAAAGEIRAAPGASTIFLRLGDKMKPGLRRAIALAIDRGPLPKKAGPGSAESKTLAGGAESPAQDLAGALAALVSDYPDLKTPRLRLLVGKGPVTEELGRAVRDQLELALATSVRIDLREGPPYQAAFAAGDYDLALASFAPEAGDPQGVLDLFPDGRASGEKKVLDEALAVPLVREGEWFAAKSRVIAKPGIPLASVSLKK